MINTSNWGISRFDVKTWNSGGEFQELNGRGKRYRWFAKLAPSRGAQKMSANNQKLSIDAHIVLRARSVFSLRFWNSNEVWHRVR